MPTTDRETLVATSMLELAGRTYACDVADLLHDLTAHTAALTDVRAVGAILLDEAGQPDHVASSDELRTRLEENPLTWDEGPCPDSARSGTALAPVRLLPTGTYLLRWPRFTPQALRLGITSVAAVPLRTAEHRFGAIALMSTVQSPPSERDLRLAQTLADAAGTWLQQRQALRAKDETVKQLETALQTRIIIEQAKGALSSRLSIDVDEAFALLRSYARSRQRKLRDVATLVLSGNVPHDLDTTR